MSSNEERDFAEIVARSNANKLWSLDIIEALHTNLSEGQAAYHQEKAEELARALAKDAGIEVRTRDQMARLLALFLSASEEPI